MPKLWDLYYEGEPDGWKQAASADPGYDGQWVNIMPLFAEAVLADDLADGGATNPDPLPAFRSNHLQVLPHPLQVQPNLSSRFPQ